MARITVASLADRVDAQGKVLGEVASALSTLTEALSKGQHSTPAAVAEKTVEAVSAKSASDIAKEHVESQGLAFARGGRVLLTTDALQACVRVLRTGQTEVVKQSGLGSLDKRHIVGIAVFRTDDKNGVATQYCFQPGDAPVEG